jgi:hypothetical protein
MELILILLLGTKAGKHVLNPKCLGAIKLQKKESRCFLDSAPYLLYVQYVLSCTGTCRCLVSLSLSLLSLYHKVFCEKNIARPRRVDHNLDSRSMPRTDDITDKVLVCDGFGLGIRHIGIGARIVPVDGLACPAVVSPRRHLSPWLSCKYCSTVDPSNVLYRGPSLPWRQRRRRS